MNTLFSTVGSQPVVSLKKSWEARGNGIVTILNITVDDWFD